MEGVLWKWTNYWNGWQPRWFILDKGILTYYKSQEEVNQGCKGSVKVSACEINVHQTDSRRLDLVIPSEQHFYLRASTPQERQQWLVALGSSKAAFGSQQKASTGEKNPDNLKLKKSELRLYCDLLMQQVHTIKSSVGDVNQPDFQKMDEAAGLLSATCDTFIQTLEDCMKLANANFTYELPHQEVTDSALPLEGVNVNVVTNPVIPSMLQNSKRSVKSNSRQSSSERRKKSCSSTPPVSPTSQEASFADITEEPKSPGSAEATGENAQKPTIPTTNNHVNDLQFHSTREVQTFFSMMEHSFVELKLTPEQKIPTENFLKCCRSIIPVFDILGSTAFAPVKMDIQGNIQKIHQKHQSDTKKFETLQDIVQQEIDTATTTVRNSATDALLWLKRALEFIHEFLFEIKSGEPDLAQCASIAYTKTLKSYHSWVVRGVFAVTLRAMPDLEMFLSSMAPSPVDAEHRDYKKQVFEDTDQYVTSLKFFLDILHEFYEVNDLDKHQKV